MLCAAPLSDAKTPQAFIVRIGGNDLIENLAGNGECGRVT
jgi:hypothetical protein